MPIQSDKVTFTGAGGDRLDARLDRPSGLIRAYAVFAHCFTCSKDIFAAARISTALAETGIAVLRFDFTGLGMSEGEFANTNFSSNVADLHKAIDFLRRDYRAPALLIGHSLGGAAVLMAAGDVPEVKAVATIGAPADAEHVIANFQADLSRIEDTGEAEVTLAGRKFTIRKQFLDDVRGQKLMEKVGRMRKALLLFHAPLDDTVGIDNAGMIFQAAKHPKSFISLDKADHLLRRREDAVYVAGVLSAWAGRYLEETSAEARGSTAGILVSETGNGKFQQSVGAGSHSLVADEPADAGGLGSGPNPYEFLSIALGACTSMTLRMYADRKGLALGRISVAVNHAKIHAEDCVECVEGRTGMIDRFERVIRIDGVVTPDVEAKVIEIAGKCPVHRTLEHGSVVATSVGKD